MSMIDLSTVTAPQVVEALDFEAIFAQLKDELLARLPGVADVLELESEPLTKLLQVAAYRTVAGGCQHLQPRYRPAAALALGIFQLQRAAALGIGQRRGTALGHGRCAVKRDGQAALAAAAGSPHHQTVVQAPQAGWHIGRGFGLHTAGAMPSTQSGHFLPSRMPSPSHVRHCSWQSWHGMSAVFGLTAADWISSLRSTDRLTTGSPSWARYDSTASVSRPAPTP